MLLPFALCGFSLAQSVYFLLLQTPEFLVARQSTAHEVQAMVLSLSFLIPLVLSLPGWLLWKKWPVIASIWCWIICSLLAALFLAQLLQQSIGAHWLLFLVISMVSGCLVAWLLLFTRWSLLGTSMAAIAVVFPAWFLLASPSLERMDSFASMPPERLDPEQPLPNIVFVVLDELPIATLLDDNHQVNEKLFPGFARLQSISNWYYDTTTASPGTVDAVPAILTGRFPSQDALDLTFENQPENLFTFLRSDYQYNVVEAVTRLCPKLLCPRSGPGLYVSTMTLLLDLAAIYAHRVAPLNWTTILPDVASNWSGFVAARHLILPQHWLKKSGDEPTSDWPGRFRQFIDSIQPGSKSTFNFMHIIFPHGPYGYLPDGKNYGRVWMRGADKQRWDDVEWAIVSGKQRHYLQVQYADRLLNEMLDHLQQNSMLEDSLLVVVADHGINFARNEKRRSLTDLNTAAILRVPLFIKSPGQTEGRRIDGPVSTIDIVPTLMSVLGFASAQLETDGVVLGPESPAIHRKRFIISRSETELKELDESNLDISALVAASISQLNLASPQGALWEIGPYDKFRGQSIRGVCERVSKKTRVSFDAFRAIENASKEQIVPAFVSGKFTGAKVPLDSMPFLITSREVIVGSGFTWAFNERARFFAMVEPKYVRQENWSPKAWLVAGSECMGQ